MEVFNTTSTTDPTLYYNYLNKIAMNPVVLVIIAFIIVGLIVFSSLGRGSEDGGYSSDSSGAMSSVFGMIIIVVLVILIAINAFQYFFSVDVSAYVEKLFQPNPVLDIVVNQNQGQGQSIYPSPQPLPEIKFRKQVFNIPGNYYSYDSAKALCKAYGSELANYSQIEKAYNAGGEWCNYGWSDGQTALFPTQRTTFDTLQEIPGHENDCGRPGINGGYMANPKLKFGVNCYGNKPKITDEEEELLKIAPRFPETQEDILFDKKVNFWKTHIDNILVSPFNPETWSQV